MKIIIHRAAHLSHVLCQVCYKPIHGLPGKGGDSSVNFLTHLYKA